MSKSQVSVVIGNDDAISNSDQEMSSLFAVVANITT